MTDRRNMSEKSAEDVKRLMDAYPESIRDHEVTALLLTLAWLYGHSQGFADYRDGVRSVLRDLEGPVL